MEYIGKSELRVDAYGKVTGKAKYTADLAPKNCYIAKVLHSTIANGEVIKFDIEEAKKIEGVIDIFTCFDVPDVNFPTAGHPYSLDPSHRDIADRHLLNSRVRFYGDDIAVVVAVDEVSATKALNKIKVYYNEFPMCLSARENVNNYFSPLHPDLFKDNIISHTVMKTNEDFDYEEALKKAISIYGKDNLIEIKKNIKTPLISHGHLELPVSYAYIDTNGKITVVASTQIPHIVRRCTATALNVPIGKIRIIKPYIGGGFGNKQDALYEPLNAWLTTKVGGHPVLLEISREETITSTRTRHKMDADVKGVCTKDGKLLFRSLTNYVNNGAYASHGNSITAKCSGIFKNLYKNPMGCIAESYTVYTNTPTSGAMRAYGVPQSISFAESLIDDLCFKADLDPYKFRIDNIVEDGFSDGKVKFYSYGLKECLKKGYDYINWEEKRKKYKSQNGIIRKGVGVACFMYQTGVYPISLEVSGIRMLLNQDGSMQLQMGATEIGQGADTVFTQIAAETIGISLDKIYIISTQDTDLTPYDSGAYGSRQSYVAGNAVKQCGILFKNNILEYFIHMKPEYIIEELDIINNNIVLKRDTKNIIISLKEVATNAIYEKDGLNNHIHAEKSVETKTNTFASGCCYVDLEVNMNMGIVKINDIINVHDSGIILNPLLAIGQVHGGMSMSMGYGLSEEMIIDTKTGKVLNDNLLDYKIPTAMDSPDFHVDFVVKKDPTGGYGNKALGEPPAVPCAVAIRNAILNATGCSFDEFPITPERLVLKFKKEGLI